MIDRFNKEVGDIKIININECLPLIRPYHHNKIIILRKINNLIMNFMSEYAHIMDEFND